VYFKIQVVIDAAEPAKLAEFWAQALDYVLEPPPHGFETWGRQREMRVEARIREMRGAGLWYGCDALASGGIAAWISSADRKAVRIA